MDYIADLHIHSPYSRATSKESTLAGLFAWARVKGIQIVGTGDFTHPGWFARLKEELEPAEPGLFRLRNEDVPLALPGVLPAPGPVRFLLSAEISCIYKRHGRVRKVHSLIYVPDFASAEWINARLAAIGNITSDGRPILGLDVRDLLEIALEQAPEGFLVPAHIWTPWFSIFGSRSGFDSIEECFGDLSDHVFALETGLSSDPEMNRMISSLDRFSLISNSDCHSPSKLGREANLFSTGFDYFSLRDAIRGNRGDTFRGTVEFFPEEGKYHADGHRACKVCLDPIETRRLDLLCPACGRPLTVGVLHRVLELADRETPLYPEGAPAFYSLTPLPELLSELLQVGSSSKEVLYQYGRAVARFGSEFGLLLTTPVEKIATFSPLLAESVDRVRQGRVIRIPGYDGEFGTIRVFEEGELTRLAGQGGLFGDDAPRRRRKKRESGPLPARSEADNDPGERQARGPNPEQEEALAGGHGQVLVAAGPGTGKTFTLVSRIAALIAGGAAAPERVVAITFTNKAADEVRERLTAAAGAAAEPVFVGTFHSFCLSWLRQEEPDLAVVGEEGRDRILRRLFPETTVAGRRETAEEISRYFLYGQNGSGTEPSLTVQGYLDELSRLKAIDLEGVIPSFVKWLEEPSRLQRIAAQVEHLFVDEFQDLNGSQYELVRLLGRSASLFAIGDPDQAIYGFRGSDPSYFFRFGDLSDTSRLLLTRNYRSRPAILEAAAAVIGNNGTASGLILTPQLSGRGTIERHSAPTPEAEAEFVVRRIEELMGGIEHFSLHSGRGGEKGAGRSFGDIAVLYRLSRQADELAHALERRGIPFQLVGSTPFYMRPALRGAYYFLQAAAGSDVIDHWLALTGELKGVGAAALARLEEALPISGDFLACARKVELAAAAARGLAELEEALAHFETVNRREGLAAALGGAFGFLGIEPAGDDAGRLAELAGSFGGDLSSFALHLREYAAATVYDPRAEGVSLMTLHAAKGLEFPAVFLTGLEEGLLPCSMMGTADVEEERRLFYVGLTRAKETLILTSAALRPWTGGGERIPSRFLAEIPSRLVSQTAAGGRPARRKQEQLALF